jgi:glycosyltransferase A (GT-A) superfamily protein (DUF2064 family)
MTELIVLTKPPVPGEVKTRLVPPLSFAEASQFAAAKLGLSEIVPREVPFVDQGPGGLGRKLAHVVTRACARGARVVVVTGSDHPSLPLELITAIIDEARRERVGWIPTEDGGFAAMALPRPLPGLFRNVPWSTPEVAPAIRRNARALGIVLNDLGCWYDVDTVKDLRRLASELESGGACPATRSLLRGLDPPLHERGRYLPEGE